MRKSKFFTFVFSFFPGLGHLYLGLTYRGLTLMAVFYGWIAMVVVLAGLTRTDRVMVFMVLLPVIWFYALLDALNCCERMQQGEQPEDRSPLTELSEGLETGQKSRLWAILFSFVPGAGHMYLGWQEKGLGLMLAFFGAFFLMDWLRLSLFLFLLPVIWFYSLFDALQLVSGNTAEAPGELHWLTWLAQRQRWLGIGLIALGVMVIFDRLVSPFIPSWMQEMIRTGLVAALLIGGGLRLALGSSLRPESSDNDLAGQEEEE